MSALKKVAGISLYHQIMEDLRREIKDMAYGEQIETEQQLAVKYDVSRGTVRQAITSLVNEYRDAVRLKAASRSTILPQ